MISLELFKKIMLDIEKQEEVDEKLTELLVCKDCTGWVSTAEDIIQDLYKLLSVVLGDKYEYIEWWLYDTSEGHKFIYEPIDENTECVMDLNNVEDLYYYIIGEHESVKQFTQPKVETDTFTQECRIGDMINCFAEQYDCGGYTVDDIYEYLGKAKKPDISNIELK